MAVLALAISTWILSSPDHRPAFNATPGKGDLPGYYLKNAILTDYDAAGMPSIRLEADRMDQIDLGTEVALSSVRLDYQAPNGQNWVLVGDVGHVRPGGQVIDVAGNVRLQGDATARGLSAVMFTDALSYDVPTALVTTKSDVRIEFGKNTLTGRGLVANLKERTIRLEQKVNGRFQR
jgi:LPS export ABC transporter protein LptC